MIGLGEQGIEGIGTIWGKIVGDKSVTLFDIGDMVNIIISFADDEGLFKASMFNRKMRSFILYEESQKGQGRLIRVLRY